MKCFYHSKDLDGKCSGAIVKRFKPGVELIGINYGEPFPWDSIKQNEEVYMVDFSLQPFEDMKKLNEMCRLTWIDHHISAIDEAKKHPEVEIDGIRGEEAISKLAACDLVWQWFNFKGEDNKLAKEPHGVYLIGRYDVWVHSHPQTIPFQMGMRTLDASPSNDSIWNLIFENDSIFIEETIKRGLIIRDYQAQSSKNYVDSMSFKTTLQGHSALAANRGMSSSALFESYTQEDIHLFIAFSWIPSGKWTVSLYANKEDVDVSQIAKSFGGGGHHAAAGFQCERLPFYPFLACPLVCPKG